MNRYALAVMASLLILIAGVVRFASVDLVCDLASLAGCEEIDQDCDGNLQTCDVGVGWFKLTVATQGGIESIRFRNRGYRVR